MDWAAACRMRHVPNVGGRSVAYTNLASNTRPAAIRALSIIKGVSMRVSSNTH